jgi:hypothetical protein
MATRPTIIILAWLLGGCGSDGGSPAKEVGSTGREGGAGQLDLGGGAADLGAAKDAAAAGGCPVAGYPARSPACDKFLANPKDGLKAALNRTSTCTNPPALGQPAAKCWDDGPVGTERYAGFCINVDGRGVCVIGHLGGPAGSTTLTWDDKLDCIDGEAAKTTAGAKTCLPLCAGQTDKDNGAPCAGGRYCVKTKVEGGERFVCGGKK